MVIDVELTLKGHIKGSLNVPLDEIGKAMSWLIKDVPDPMIKVLNIVALLIVAFLV